MTLYIKVKQAKDVEDRTIENVKFHHFDKNYLVISKENSKKTFLKTSTVLEINEI